jgi:hypothetical protein
MLLAKTLETFLGRGWDLKIGLIVFYFFGSFSFGSHQVLALMDWKP